MIQKLDKNGNTSVDNANVVILDKNGNVKKIAAASGTVTSILTASPITGGPITSSGTIGITQATTSTDGYLSSTDWNTFNSKFNLPTLTSGSILFSNGTTIAQKNSNFFWDNTNNRLGIGTNAPTDNLNVIGGITTKAAASNTQITMYDENSSTYTQIIKRRSNNTGNFGLPVGSSEITTNTAFGINSNAYVAFATLGIERARFATTTGNLLINTTTDNGGKLQIKAPGALSTDIALRVRNSADTADLATISGTGNILSNVHSVGISTVGIGYDSNIGINIGSVISGNGWKVNLMDNGNNIYGFFGWAGSILTDRNTSGRAVLTGTSALLEMQSTAKGFLPPRMTNAQRIAIATPAVGLCVYCTDVVEGLYINKSTGWTFIG